MNNLLVNKKEGFNLITYDDIVYFYKDKENIVNYEPQKDDCHKLAETFFYGSGAPDDCAYSSEMKKRMIKGTLTLLATFKYFSEEEAFKLVLSGFIPIKQGNKMVINPSQKWHLYVSYLAYQEVKAELKFPSKASEVPGNSFDKEKFIFKAMVKQKEYVKWMKKAAVGDENASWDDVEKQLIKKKYRK